MPAYIRPDRGPEFFARAVRQQIAALGARTDYIKKASPWENGYVKSSNGKLGDEHDTATNAVLLHHRRERGRVRRAANVTPPPHGS